MHVERAASPDAEGQRTGAPAPAAVVESALLWGRIDGELEACSRCAAHAHTRLEKMWLDLDAVTSAIDCLYEVSRSCTPSAPSSGARPRPRPPRR
jgi:hypothetical protein